MTIQEPHVRIEHDPAGNGIAWLIFDHEARRNAMTIDMWRQVPVLCQQLTDDASVRVVILRGAGEQAFVAGADISQFQSERTSDSSGSYDEATDAAYKAIEMLPKPVIAMVHGFCIGGGLAIALSADIRYVADDARFALPPAKLGIGYASDGVDKLVSIVGPSVAKEIIFTADISDATTALDWGLVNRVVPKNELEAFALAQATTMTLRAPLSQRAAKLAVANDPGTSAAIEACMASEDYAEGVAAFLEKRTPQFKGS